MHRSGWYDFDMPTREDIQAVCDTVVRNFHPRKVVLFGSHAHGSPTPDSDVDLLVIMPFEGSPARKAYEIDLRLEHRFPLDLLVRTPEFVERRLAMKDGFMLDVMGGGRVLYDAVDAFAKATTIRAVLRRALSLA